MNVKDVERHVAELEQDGYTIIPDVLSSAELEATREAMEEVLAAEEAVSRKFGLQTEDLKHSFNVQGKHRHFYGFLLRNPAPLEVARAVLGADMFCHDMAIRNPLPTGKKDKKRLGGTCMPTGQISQWFRSPEANTFRWPCNRFGPFLISA